MGNKIERNNQSPDLNLIKHDGVGIEDAKRLTAIEAALQASRRTINDQPLRSGLLLAEFPPTLQQIFQSLRDLSQTDRNREFIFWEINGQPAIGGVSLPGINVSGGVEGAKVDLDQKRNGDLIVCGGDKRYNGWCLANIFDAVTSANQPDFQTAANIRRELGDILSIPLENAKAGDVFPNGLRRAANDLHQQMLETQAGLATGAMAIIPVDQHQPAHVLRVGDTYACAIYIGPNGKVWALETPSSANDNYDAITAGATHGARFSQTKSDKRFWENDARNFVQQTVEGKRKYNTKGGVGVFGAPGQINEHIESFKFPGTKGAFQRLIFVSSDGFTSIAAMLGISPWVLALYLGIDEVLLLSNSITIGTKQELNSNHSAFMGVAKMPPQTSERVTVLQALAIARLSEGHVPPSVELRGKLDDISCFFDLGASRERIRRALEAIFSMNVNNLPQKLTALLQGLVEGRNTQAQSLNEGGVWIGE